jgi:hypothetical protein
MGSRTVKDLASTLTSIRNGNFTNDELNLISESVKFARNQNARRAANTLKIGQQVRFTSLRGSMVGQLAEIKIKNAIVATTVGRYRVPLSMLEAV